MTYTRKNGIYRLETPHGVFTGTDEARVKLEALMAQNAARHRQEVADRHREIAREVQAQELAMREAQGR